MKRWRWASVGMLAAGAFLLLFGVIQKIAAAAGGIDSEVFTGLGWAGLFMGIGLFVNGWTSFGYARRMREVAARVPWRVAVAVREQRPWRWRAAALMTFEDGDGRLFRVRMIRVPLGERMWVAPDDDFTLVCRPGARRVVLGANFSPPTT